MLVLLFSSSSIGGGSGSGSGSLLRSPLLGLLDTLADGALLPCEVRVWFVMAMADDLVAGAEVVSTWDIDEPTSGAGSTSTVVDLGHIEDVVVVCLVDWVERRGRLAGCSSVEIEDAFSCTYALAAEIGALKDWTSGQRPHRPLSTAPTAKPSKHYDRDTMNGIKTRSHFHTRTTNQETTTRLTDMFNKERCIVTMGIVNAIVESSDSSWSCRSCLWQTGSKCPRIGCCCAKVSKHLEALPEGGCGQDLEVRQKTAEVFGSERMFRVQSDIEGWFAGIRRYTSGYQSDCRRG